MATLRVKLHEMSVFEVESARITYEQGRKVQRALAGATGSTGQMFPMDTRRHKICYACDGVRHAWQCCRESVTKEGAAKLAAKASRSPRISSFGRNCGMNTMEGLHVEEDTSPKAAEGQRDHQQRVENRKVGI
jgi:hypothetical protein